MRQQAFLPGILLLAACADPGPVFEAGAASCTTDPTPITQIQGMGERSPLVGTTQTVQGVVSLVAADSGFYLEEKGSGVDPRSSKALFISDADLASTVSPGQQLAVSGVVAELGTGQDTLTALVEINRHEVCTLDSVSPLTRIQLPLNSADREALEGMRVYFEQTLTLTDVYNLARGELTLSSAGVLRVPTEVVRPGPEANEREAENRDHSINATIPGIPPAMAVGSTTGYAIGLMGHSGRGQQLWLDSTPGMDSLPLPASPSSAGEASIRVVSSNLLNFFNGDGTGAGFPTERGAESLQEFQIQSARTQAVMAQLKPDLLAVQELENDGFGPHSAASSLLNLLNGAGQDDWAFINANPDGIGEDVITVGLFYRQQVLEAIGPPYVLDRPEFRHLSRQPLVQAFQDTASGTRFLVAVNHLKSKGSCPDNGVNADQGDGQGCWNVARVAAVQAEVDWLKQLAAESNTENVLVLGDMNAWRNEDPVQQFAASGLVDLVEARGGLPQTSFLYWGQTGTLDYAFASPPLAALTQQAFIWHINSGWPSGMELPLPWLRSSDHDPVIVDFDFNQSSTSD